MERGIMSTHVWDGVNWRALDSGTVIRPPRPDATIQQSTTPDRANPFAVAGATAKGDIYVFASLAEGAGVEGVTWYLDGAVSRTDYSWPYDLVGDNNLLALPLDTAALTNGAHTLTMAVSAAGVITEVSAAFTVDNYVAPPVTRIAVTYTDEEVTQWRTRSTAGPYRVESDVSTNSPAEWTRIDAEKIAFLAGPGNGRWNPTGTCPGCPAGAGQSGEMEPGGAYLNRLRGAAFWALVRDDTAVGRKVIAELLAQVRTTNADMSNRTRFPLTTAARHDTSPYFMMGNSLSIYFSAMDYTRKWMTLAELAEIRTWLRNGAQWLLPGLKANYDGLWRNRAAGDYTPVEGALTAAGCRCTCAGFQYTRTSSGSAGIGFYGGPPTSNVSRHYNNRAGAQETAFALIGIDQNLPNLKAEARRWFKEYIMFSVYPDAGSAGETNNKISWTGGGWVGEFERFEQAGQAALGVTSETGVSYSGKALSFATMIADAFAREGDPSLYDYQTTNGVHGTEGAGQPPKSLLYALSTLAKHLSGTIVRYGTEFAEFDGTYNYRMDGHDPISGKETVDDVHSAAIANLYYRNALLKRAYTRGAGFRPYPATPNSDGRGSPYQGPWGLSAGGLLQAGGMEQTVNPYGAS